MNPNWSDVTIIVPAFNESAAIEGVLRELQGACGGATLIVVDDGSTDDTGAIGRRFGVTVLRNERRQGYGAALKLGIRSAITDYVVIFDGDGQFFAEDVSLIVHTMKVADAALVSGQRSTHAGVALSRRPGKLILRWVARLLTNERFPDINCGFRAFRRSQIQPWIGLLPDGFSASLTSNIVCTKFGYKVLFHPIRCRPRLGKSSVRQFRDGFSVILLVVRLIALFDPLRIFLPPAIALIGFSTVYSLYESLYHQLGVPVLGAVGFLTGLIVFFMGILCDQISSLRLQRFDPIHSTPR